MDGLGALEGQHTAQSVRVQVEEGGEMFVRTRFDGAGDAPLVEVPDVNKEGSPKFWSEGGK